MSAPRLGVGIIGCGVIAQSYARDLASYPELDTRGVADLDFGRAKKLATAFGWRAYDSIDDLLADDSIDIVVNLTSHFAHAEVTSRSLDAGKHVHSEKPIALSHGDATMLVRKAAERGLRLGASPAVFMGEAQQTAMKFVRDGGLGPVRVVYAEGNWGMIEDWHPAPQGFYEVGPLLDIGVYALTMTTAMFGPAARVTAFGSVVKPERTTKAGAPFRAVAPDYVTLLVELRDQCVLRLTTTFYVGKQSRQVGLEFHGDDGTLWLENWQRFDARVEHARRGGEYETVPPLREPYRGPEWGRGVRDLAAAIVEDRPHRATGEHAAHVAEILDAARQSIETGNVVTVSSTFAPPAPMHWAS